MGILINTKDQLFDLADKVLTLKLKVFGMDIETDAVPYPHGRIAGVSLYNSELNSEAYYIPINHINGSIDKDLDPFGFIETLARHFVCVFHHASYDMLFLRRENVRFYKIIDTSIMARMLQFQHTSLKDLALEFGLEDYKNIVKYSDLIKKSFNLTEKEIEKFKTESELLQAYPFSDIDILNNTEALDYACNDAKWAFELAQKFIEKYQQLTNLPEQVLWEILDAEFNTTILLTESSSKGFIFDEKMMLDFVKTYTEEVKESELNLKNRFRELLNWEKADKIIKTI